jgi:hypothetical protein
MRQNQRCRACVAGFVAAQATHIAAEALAQPTQIVRQHARADRRQAQSPQFLVHASKQHLGRQRLRAQPRQGDRQALAVLAIGGMRRPSTSSLARPS